MSTLISSHISHLEEGGHHDKEKVSKGSRQGNYGVTLAFGETSKYPRFIYIYIIEAYLKRLTFLVAKLSPSQDESYDEVD